MPAKFKLGQKVRVNHRNCGTWEGEVVYAGCISDFDEGGTWEYAVTNSPLEREPDPDFPDDALDNDPIWRWHPLAWEDEVETIE